MRRPSSSLPHARGGVSVVSQGRDERHQSSPRTWGCFSLRCSRRVRCFVFPTHVGVFLFIIARAFPSLGLPHARGGVSRTEDGMAGGVSSSPRTWGCFHLPRLLPGPSLVFPTHVGVFPIVDSEKALAMRLPHARGGVSVPSRPSAFYLRSSPRTWGCFSTSSRVVDALYVFPTHVGGRQAGVAPESPFPTVGAFHVCP